MHGWSARGQVFWWHGWQETRWRRTIEYRDQGRHWRGWLVPLKRITDSVPAEAARCAGPESAPMNRSARSSRAVVCVTREPAGPVAGAGRDEAAGLRREGLRVLPRRSRHQPSWRNRLMRAFQCRWGQRLAAVPAPR